MKVLDLCCDQEHRFEGWFASMEAMQAQLDQGLLQCPVCSGHNIRRLPSAPHVARSGSAGSQEPERSAHYAALNSLLHKLRDAAENSEDVGKQFAEEARRIHYGKAPERAIRGQTSLDEAGELIEEGINVLPIPPAKEALH